MTFMLAFFCGCVILFPVMRNIANTERQRRELKKAWEAIHPVDRPTWEQFKRGQFVLPKTARDRDFPIAAMEDRDRRAKQWAEHLAKKSDI
jgi:nitroimidazol reductase NimA-like FMN-containing flavoprotein (pyridoxamine 5'-phosphate oxidase superfamily)